MVTVILTGLAVLAVYCASLFRYPFRPCLKCGGIGTNKGSNRKRWGACPRCKGARQVRRIGATAVHKFWWSIAGERLRDRRKENARKAREKAGYPE